MIYKHNFTLPEEFVAEIAEQNGLFAELLGKSSMPPCKWSARNIWGSSHMERGPERRDQANGYKPKTMKTRVGDITFEIPQVRDGDFYPRHWKKGCGASGPCC